MISRIAITLLIMLTLTLVNSCRNTTIESRWAESAVEVDGANLDWAEYPLNYFENERAAVGVANDSEYLYLIFSTRDEQTIRMLEMNGIALRFNGDDKRGSGIRYLPTLAPDNSLEYNIRTGARLTAQQQEMIKRKRRRLRNKIEVLGLPDPLLIPANGSQGPAAAASFVQGAYSCEFRIPIVGSDSAAFAVATPLGEAVNLEIGVGGGAPANREMMRERRDKSGGGSKGGGRGGRGGGRGGGGMPQGRTPPDKEKSIKLTLITAVGMNR